MYLMDAIQATAAMTRENKNADHPTLRVFPEMASRLAGVPRFLLDENAVAAAVEISLGRPKILLEALAHCRVPYSAMWVEWPESGREKLRRDFTCEITPDRPLPTRVGFLIETETGGRRGHATWVWSAPGDIGSFIPNIAPIEPYFDLDEHFVQPVEKVEGFKAANLAAYWADNPVQQQALLDFWCTARHKPSPWGMNYLATTAMLGDVEERIAYAMADVYGEYIMIWSIMFMLTASRPAVSCRDVSRAKINKVRARKREVPLLDHTEVVMHVNRQPTAMRRAPLGHARKSPRVHLVSRYLARRGDKFWVTEPYWRGSGEAIHRVVNVKK